MEKQAIQSAIPRAGLQSKWDGFDTFTIEQAAEIVGISKGSAYAAAAAGTLPTISFGRRKLVPRAPLERLLGYR
jgi:excisionase family DNA binding protein